LDFCPVEPDVILRHVIMLENEELIMTKPDKKSIIRIISYRKWRLS